MNYHIGRNAAIRCAGNGVVWQAAAHALTELGLGSKAAMEVAA